MSPEGVSHSIEEYLCALRKQAHVAEAFFYGRVGEAIAGFLSLPEEVQLRINQLIWSASGGEPVDLADEASARFIADAILFSLEERMGLQAS